MRGIFKEMYLDTNAWSELAKRNYSSYQLDSWIVDNSGFLALSPLAAFEIRRDSRLSERRVRKSTQKAETAEVRVGAPRKIRQAYARACWQFF